MITVIAKKELQSLFRNGRFWVTSAVLLLLLSVSFVLSFQNIKTSNEERVKAQISSRHNWLSQTPKNPHKAAHFGNFAFRLKTPLSVFDNGLDSYTGTSIYLEPHKTDDFQFSPAEEATSLLRFGELTPAFVLQSILPLLIIFLCFNAVSKEREDSTLKLLLSREISVQKIMLGKVTGDWVALMLIILPVFIILALCMPFQRNAPAPDVWLRYLLLMVDYACYTAIVVIVCVVVSAYSYTSRASLMKLLGLWILCCIIIPKIAGNAGSILYRTPSQYAYAGWVKHDEENGLNGHDANDKRRSVLLKKLLAKYHADTVTALPINFDAVAMVESEKYTTSVYRKRINEVRHIFSLQNKITQLTAFINPFQAVQLTSMTLAGTDYPHFTFFQDNAEKYRLYFVNTMNDFMVTHTKSGDWTTPFGNEVYHIIRPFNYNEPTIAWAVKHSVLSFIAMLFWIAVCAVLVATTKINIA